MSESDPAVTRILAALSGQDHPRAHLLGDLGEATLRRAPDHLLTQPVDEVVTRLSRLLDRLDAADPEQLAITLRRDPDAPTRGLLEVLWRDRPFLLSTINAQLESAGVAVRGTFHPIIGVQRDDQGRLSAIRPARGASSRISAIQLEVADLPPAADGSAGGDGAPDPLLAPLRAALEDVATVTDDHAGMRATIEAGAASLATADVRDGEVAAWLAWLLDDNVLLLGTQTVAGPGAPPDADHGLGLLRDRARRHRLLARLGAATRCDDLPRLKVSRTRERSPVQRRVPMEVFDVQLPDGSALRVLALMTRKGIAEPVRTTPVLRRRVQRTLELEDVVDGSHDAITIITLAHALPKDELLRATQLRTRELLLGLLQAEQHRQVTAFVNPHRPSGTVSVVLALPRERWQPELARRLRSELLQRFDASRAEVDTATDLQRDAVVRFLLELRAPDDPETFSERLPAATQGLSDDLAALVRPWEESLLHELAARTDSGTASSLARRIVGRLPLSYRDVTDPEQAVIDVLLLSRAIDTDQELLVALRNAPEDSSAPVRLLAAKSGDTLELSAFLPTLESLGLTIVDEVPHELQGPEGPDATLHDFGVRAPSLDAVADGARIADAILAAWRGHLEVDPLNQLIVVAGLDWHDISILRAFRRLRRQLGTAYTPAYVDTILTSHPDTVRALVDHIHARFDPDRAPDPAAEAATRATVLEHLDRLQRLDHDRILRRLLELVDATLRTNAFRMDARADDTGEPYIALKIDPSRISDAPEPRPYREIFVHSPRVEGVHLRSGEVSRGGLRWSDRRDDVRSEVLDLVKAQVLKNAVIVPSGAKGGFVLTREPEDPTAAAAEARRQYVTFIRGLLDVTDDLEGDRVVPPPGVVRHDGDDPYLVVAADRGTATFSDTANAVAARTGFWLDDAFASGGRHGYDHKRYGVTAKGAWVAVTNHFRELGINIATEPVTVAGIGDMSGDVFGNGLLRSRSVRLVAAFDHRHVFLDPDPDPEASYTERARLFELPGSCWDDYDRAALSEGAMIVSRNAKRIALTEQVRDLLRVDAQELTPPELIRAVLRAPVDLLFAGGIGTYLRASTEPDSELGDRANADVRVEASTVRARVVGEGANLALTQRARIELARRGTLLNQDAIDNAAGVATSDQEVNLKILLRAAEERGLLTRAQRNDLLEELADEVVERALGVVAASSRAISREVDRSSRNQEAYDVLLRRLEDGADLDRVAEVLPTSEELTSRAGSGAGLSRPELATLMAWAKRELKEALLASPLPDHPLCRPALERSLPPTAVARFGDLLDGHRLRRELITTVLTNELVDRLGVTAVSRLAGEAGVELTDAAAALQAAIHIVDAGRWWSRLDELTDAHDPARLRELELPLEELVLTLARILLTDPTAPDPLEAAEEQRATATRLLEGLHGLGTTGQRQARNAHVRWLLDDLVEPDLTHLLADARDLALVPDVVAVRSLLPADPGELRIADALLRLSERLGIDRLEEALRRVDARSGWARRERLGLAMDLRRARRSAAVLTLQPLAARAPEGTGAAAAGATAGRGFAATGDGTEVAQVSALVDTFLAARRAHLERTRETVAAAEAADTGSLDALGVAARAVRETIERRPRVSRDAAPGG